MKKEIIKIGAVFLSMAIAAAISQNVVFAAATTSPTKGEQALERMINAESARLAELNAKFDPSLGIVHTLQKNARGNDVKLMQQFLMVYGVYPDGFITGYFGPLTEAAVRRFQEKESIESVGIVGPKTRARILEISRQKSGQNLTAPISASTTAPLPVSVVATSSAAATPEISDAVLSADIAENGSAASPSAAFASTTPNIYAVISMKNAAVDTKIAYIRYYEKSYVDSGISHPSRVGVRYLHFQWALKSGKNRVPGNYSIVFYVNGKKSRTINYAIY